MESVTVSVIVPIGYIDAYTETCLSSLFTSAQQSQITYEVILVCNGLKDSEIEWIAHRFANPHMKMLTYPSHIGPARARVAGTDVASGQYYAFTDADCIIPPSWLHTMFQMCQRYPVCSSNIVAANDPKNIYAQIEEKIDFFRNAVDVNAGRKIFCAYNSLMVQKDFLSPASETIDNTIHSIETALRYLQQGVPIGHVDILSVAQFYPASLRECLKRRKRHAKGLAFLQVFPFSTTWHQLHMHTPFSYLQALPGQAKKMQLSPPAFVLYLFLQTVFTLFWQFYRVRYALWKFIYSSLYSEIEPARF
jgi:glycosyltransferase involved in cell wall biosynthesis